MSDLLYDFFQVCLVLMVFSIVVVGYYIRNSPKNAFSLLLFLLIGICSGGLLNDMLLKQYLFTPVVFPFIVPLFYALGPLLLVHYRSHYDESSAKDLLHFLPVGFLFLDTIIHQMVFPQDFMTNTELARAYNFREANFSFFLSGAFILVTYPCYILGYASYILVEHLGNKRNKKQLIFIFLLIVALMSIVLQDLVLYYHLDLRLFPVDINIVRFSLSLIGPLLLFYSLVVFKTAINKRLSRPKGSLTDLKILEIDSFTHKETFNDDSPIYQKGMGKIEYIAASPFSEKEWENYLRANSMTFSDYKRKVRIERTKHLIQEGYLVNYSIESLSDEVGYRSRSSFYASFEQTAGMKLSEFRKSLGSN